MALSAPPNSSPRVSGWPLGRLALCRGRQSLIIQLSRRPWHAQYPSRPQPSHATGFLMTDDELLQHAKADHAFLTRNQHKVERERWVLDQWLAARGLDPKKINQGQDPPDFDVDGGGVEIVEAMEAGRRRGDNYKARLEAAKVGDCLVRHLPSLRDVCENGHEWILQQVQQKLDKKYDPSASKHWMLLVYANFSFVEQVQWELLEARLTEMSPPFASVEIFYSIAGGHFARVVFAAGKD